MLQRNSSNTHETRPRRKQNTSATSWLIVGLGNPGTRYEKTRHNVGFWLLSSLRKTWGLSKFVMHPRIPAQVVENGRTPCSPDRVVMASPHTFMNESGVAVAPLAHAYRVPLERTVILHDDKDLAFGTLRLQRQRSSAGHRGVQSVIDHLGSRAFWRLRIGVGVKEQMEPTDTFVLRRFTAEEQEALQHSIFPQAEALLRTLLGGSKSERHIARRIIL